MTQQYPTEVYQFLAVAIILALGIVFIRAFRQKKSRPVLEVPASKCHKDFTSIMGCIEDSTTNEQLEKPPDAVKLKRAGCPFMCPFFCRFDSGLLTLDAELPKKHPIRLRIGAPGNR